MSTTRQTALIAIFAAFALSSCSPPSQNGDVDLVAASVTHKPNPVHVGDKVVFDHVVANAGTSTVKGGTYYVDLYLGKEDVSFDHDTTDILPGGSVPYSMRPGYFHWQPTNAGRYHYRFVVDERNTVKERVETNNILEGDIDVVP